VFSGGVLAALAVSALLAAGGRSGDRANAAIGVMSVNPPSQTVVSTATSVDVSVRLTGGAGIGAWEFGLEYDPAVLELTALTAGSFLSDQGINQQCFRKDYPTHDGLVAVQYGCGGFGQYDGASGDGTLATLTMKPKTTGTVDLIFTKRELATRIGDGIPVESADGIVKVIAPGSLDTELEPTPTANPVRLTPTALPPTEEDPYILSGNTRATPTSPSGSVSGSSGQDGSTAGGAGAGGGSGAVAGSGSAATNGGGGVASAGGGDGFPVAGSGPPPQNPNPVALVVGGMVFALGALLVTVGGRWRKRSRG